MSLEQLVNELVLVLCMLIYRRQMGIRMTIEQKIYFLDVLFKKCNQVYIEHDIDHNIHHIDGMRFHEMINEP